MKNYIAIPLMVIEVVGVVIVYAVVQDADIPDLLVGVGGGFCLGALFGWIMTSLQKESEQ